MRPIVDVYKLGRLSYAKTLDVQKSLFERLKAEKPFLSFDGCKDEHSGKSQTIPSSGSRSHHQQTDGRINQVPLDRNQTTTTPFNGFHISNLRSSLILVEHDPVYTVGLRTTQYDDKYVSRLKYKLEEHKLKAEFFKTNRGGLITFHGPGQLVVYPILNLTEFKSSIKGASVRAFVNLLELTIIDTLTQIGIAGAHTVKEYPGVWVDNGERKVAFIGITCKRRITMHGISINCDCDLKWFDFIVSCGIEEKQITSIQRELLLGDSSRHNLGTLETHERGFRDNEYDDKVGSLDMIGLPKTRSNLYSPCSIEEVAKEFCRAFSRRFSCTFKEVSNSEVSNIKQKL